MERERAACTSDGRNRPAHRAGDDRRRPERDGRRLETGPNLRSAAFASVAVLALTVGVLAARPAGTAQITISLLVSSTNQPAFQVLIPNFERIYPNITIEATYAPAANVSQTETIELAAGDAPDLLSTFPGCGTPTSVCVLAKAGDLAPLVDVPWTKRSLRSVTSLSKYGEALYVFEPQISPYGVFTNDPLFRKLGLQVPQTFAQLLKVCAAAGAAGTSAVILDGSSGLDVSLLLLGLATPAVYARDAHWTSELKAGSVTFGGTAGWHLALQELVEMNQAHCFQPGATGTSTAAAQTEFAQGQGLMFANYSSHKGAIDVADSGFDYSFWPLPGAASSEATGTFVHPGNALSVDAHAPAQNQAAALDFINFLARPKQNALYAQLTGGMTQYEFLKQQIPSFMPGFATVFSKNEYVVDPTLGWWNANVNTVFQQNAVGLPTGQTRPDDVLNAMDAAWKQGPG